MAATRIAETIDGQPYPCPPKKGGNGVVLHCGHRDCAADRDIMDSVCRHCGKRIGRRAHYSDGGGRWAHASCVEAAEEKRQREIRERLRTSGAY